MSRALFLPSVLRTADCKVETISGWQDRGRPGPFDPRAVLIHHTGTTSSVARPMPSLSTLVHGRPDLNGPLAQLGLGFDGVYRVIAAGRANHAGTARATGPMPAGDGNAMYLGIEVDYSGSQDMSPAQYAALIKGTAAILKHFGKSAGFARGHKETSSAGKWDPGRRGSSSPEYLMEGVRIDIAKALRPAPRLLHFELLTGEGKKLAETGALGEKPSTQEAKLAAFLSNPTNVKKMLADFDHDRDRKEPEDVRVVRVWEKE